MTGPGPVRAARPGTATRPPAPRPGAGLRDDRKESPDGPHARQDQPRLPPDLPVRQPRLHLLLLPGQYGGKACRARKRSARQAEKRELRRAEY
ncbi:hypothetical protein ACR6C2_07945 [Streptomyces sp. INA 01156]